ncbi:MAG TPA: LysM peptidoglycan-binding domain-containing protein [Chloroflexota bacterium]|nr:LysM peptidoglycan-binding domain-containing protein [Chloroflexota bacterium]
MRDRLQRVRERLRGKAQPWPIALGGAALGIVVGTWWLLVATSSPDATPPQAAVSAPAPTLIAVETEVAATSGSSVAPSGTPEPSPFAGIAEPPAEPPARTAPVQHTVVEGEVLWQIAEQYRLRPETVLWSNDIENPDLLLVGQHLLIPPADGVVYTVRSGDSLSDVVNRYGVELQAVLTTNKLADADQIVAGTDLFLPGGRPIAAIGAASSQDNVVQPGGGDEQATAATGAAVALPDNIDALLGAGWLRSRQIADLYKSADAASSKLHQLPGAARLERLDGFRNGRIQVRDPGDGRIRQAMTGWVNATDLDVGRAPATRELPLAYPADTAMDISHVFAPYRSQLDGSPYAEANCGPTAVGMALDAFGMSVPARQLRAAALDAQHMYGNGVGTLITALAQVVQQNGLAAMDLRDGAGALRRWSLDDIRAHIQVGHPVIVQVRYRSLPGRGGAYYFGDHYILVTGVVGDGFLYNDPIDIDGLGWDRVISSTTLRTAMNASDQRYAFTAVAVGRN